jgi:hypothetical protein
MTSDQRLRMNMGPRAYHMLALEAARKAELERQIEDAARRGVVQPCNAPPSRTSSSESSSSSSSGSSQGGPVTSISAQPWLIESPVDSSTPSSSSSEEESHGL